MKLLRRLKRSLGMRLVLLFLVLALATTGIFLAGMQRALSAGWNALLRPLVAELHEISAAEAVNAGGSGPYSLIVIDGAIEQLPDTLAAQLTDEGRIVTGLVLRQVTRLATGRKVAGRVNLQPVEDLGIPVLHAFDAPKSWTFA